MIDLNKSTPKHLQPNIHDLLHQRIEDDLIDLGLK